MSVLINALQAMPLPYESFGQYLARTVAPETEFRTMAAVLAELDRSDSEGAVLAATDQEAFQAAMVMKTAHELTERTKSAPPQSMWSSIADATKVLLRKTQDEVWVKKYHTAVAWSVI